jgi:peptidoglycan-associated lipoprotein
MNVKVIAAIGAVLLLAACRAAPPPPPPMGGPPGQPGGITSGPFAPGSQEDLAQNAGDRVFFPFDSSEITPDARGILAKQAAWLAKYPNVTVTVEGHCDKRGTREYNLALGARRAEAVKQILIAEGVAASRVSTISYGKERPIVAGDSEEDYAQNRVGITRVN